MATERELCRNCGQLHERPFSDEVLAIYQRIRASTDDGERAVLTLELAGEFSNDFDSTDESVNETLHDAVDEYVGTRVEHQQAAMRLGRGLLRGLQAYSRAERERLKKRAGKLKDKTN
jgi:hypothetical protein